MPETVEDPGYSFAAEAINGSAQYVARIVKITIAPEQEVLQLRPAQIGMVPCCCGAVEAVEILLGDPASVEEIVILLGPWDWRQDVERRNVRPETAEETEVLANRACRIFREADDVREMRQNAVFVAQLHNVTVCGGMILRLVHRQ